MAALDILYLTLAVCIALLTVFLSVTLIYLMFILRDVTKISDSLKETIEKINTYIAKPILLTKSVIEFVSPFVKSAEEKFNRKKSK